MSLKSLIAVAAIATAATFGTFATAQANPSVGVSIGFGFGDMPPPDFTDPFWEGENFVPHHRPHHFGDWPRPRPVYGVNCRQAKRIVAGAGFEEVRSVKCNGPIFAFEGWKNDDLFRIRVDIRGRIVRVTPIY